MARENDSGKIPAEQGHENRDPAEATRIGHRRPREIGGPKGPEPTRYGDWEVAGRCSDF